jgi:hypothetical protein
MTLPTKLAATHRAPAVGSLGELLGLRQQTAELLRRLDALIRGGESGGQVVALRQPTEATQHEEPAPTTGFEGDCGPEDRWMRRFAARGRHR